MPITYHLWSANLRKVNIYINICKLHSRLVVETLYLLKLFILLDFLYFN